MPYRYTIYGLTLESDRTIIGMRTSFAPHDLQVWIDTRPGEMQIEAHQWYLHPDYASRRPQDQGENPQMRILQSEDGHWIQLQYRAGLAFVLDAAATMISVTGTDDMMHGPFEAFLIGPVLGFVMRLRGILALHASGIVIDGRTLLISAASGTGKSTLASALLHMGQLITDDTAALTLSEDKWFVEPGGQRLRLWEDSSERLNLPVDQLVQIIPGYGKRYMDPAPLSVQRMPLDAIYLLRRGAVPETRITATTASTALIELVNCTYANYLIDRQMRVHEFQMLQKLVMRVPAFSLTIPNDLSRLEQVSNDVIDHFRAI